MKRQWNPAGTAVLLAIALPFAASAAGHESTELKIEPAAHSAHIQALPFSSDHPLLQMLGGQPLHLPPTEFGMAVGRQIASMLKPLGNMDLSRKGLTPVKALRIALNKLKPYKVAPALYPVDGAPDALTAEPTAKEVVHFTAMGVIAVLDEAKISGADAPPAIAIGKFLGRGLEAEDQALLAERLPMLASPELSDIREEIKARLRLDNPAILDNLPAQLARVFDSTRAMDSARAAASIEAATEKKAQEQVPSTTERADLERIRLRPVSERVNLNPSYGAAKPEAVEALRQVIAPKVQLDVNKLARAVTLASEEFEQLSRLSGMETLLRVLFDSGIHSLYVEHPTRRQWNEQLSPHGAVLTSPWVTQFIPTSNVSEFESLYRQLHGGKGWRNFKNHLATPIPIEVRPMRVDEEVDDWKDIHGLWEKFTVSRKGGMGYFDFTLPNGKSITLWARDMGERIRDGLVDPEFGMGRLEDWFVVKLYHPQTKELIAGAVNRFDHARRVVIAGMGGFHWAYMGRGIMPDGSLVDEGDNLHPADRLMFAAIDYLGNKKEGEPGYGYYWGKGHDGGQPGQHITEATLAFNKIKDGCAVIALDEILTAFVMIAPSPLGMGKGNQQKPSGVLAYPYDPDGWLVRDYFDRRDRGEKPLVGAMLPKQAIPELVNPALGIDLVHGPDQIYKELIYWKPEGANVDTHSPSQKTGVLVVPLSKIP